MAAKEVITSDMEKNVHHNALLNGDFIDLTSEGEPQTVIEEDVVLVDALESEHGVPLPIGASRPKSSSVSKPVNLLVSKNHHTNITTKEFLVPTNPVGKRTKTSVTLAEMVPTKSVFNKKTGVVEQRPLILKSSRKVGSGNRGIPDLMKLQFDRSVPQEQASSLLESVWKKVGKKTPFQNVVVVNNKNQTIVRVPTKQYRNIAQIKPFQAQKKAVENCVMRPSSSEIPKTTITKPQVDDDVVLVSTQQKNPEQQVLHINAPNEKKLIPVTVVDKNKRLVQIQQKNQKGIFVMTSSVPVNKPEALKQGEEPHQKDPQTKPVYYFLCPVNPAKNAGQEELTKETELIEENDDDDDKNEVVETKEEEQEIYIDSDCEGEDPLEKPIESTAADTAMVTPVDITKILSEAGPSNREELPERCNCYYMKRGSKVYKGFTVREMKKPECFKILQSLIIQNNQQIGNLKKSMHLRYDNFFSCGRTLNNFMPEVARYDDDDDDSIEYPIEYSSIHKELYTSQIPAIASVISQVNEEVAELKSKKDITPSFTKPETALKLIQKGLELIRSWSAESKSIKEKANKSLPPTTRRSATVNAKKRAKSVEPVVAVSPPKATTRTKRRKVEPPAIKEPVKRRVRGQRVVEVKVTPSSVNTHTPRKRKTEKTEVDSQPPKTSKDQTSNTVSSRGRKRKKIDYDFPNDNELFIVKKVDILTNNRRK